MLQLLDDEQRDRRPRVDPSRISAGVAVSIDRKFRPEARHVFALHGAWKKVPVTDGGAAPWLRRLFVRGDRALCLRHPALGAGTGPLATPTSSPRTLFVFHDHPFFVKLSLPAEDRALTPEEAARCVRRSALVRALTGPRGLALLPETLAIGGCIVRELPRTDLRPWFAVAHRRLIVPFLKAWLVSAIEQGWTPAAHAQNLLVGGGRFWVRDFEDVGVDLPWVAARFGIRDHGLDPRDEADGLETSLHTFFVGGPAYALKAQGLVFQALKKLTGIDARDPRRFADWIREQREAQLRAPKVPRRLAAWLKLEQTVNARSRDPKHFAKVDLSPLPPRFRPEARPVFRLPYLNVPRSRVHVRASPVVPPPLKQGLFDGDRVRVFFHPMMAGAHALDLAEHPQGLEVFWASPTASPRSLVVWPDGRPERAFGLKVSLDLTLLGLNRLIGVSKLERAVAVSECLARTKQPYFAEPISVRLKDAAWGSIGRSLAGPLGVPGFSRPLPMAALVRTFAALAFGEGLLPDLHQQNVLRLADGRLKLRDLDSVKTDVAMRALRKKTLAPFARSAGTPAMLKTDLGSSHYDEAWDHSLRADWLWLAGKQHARAIDHLLLVEARRWLGDAVVDAELRRAGPTPFSLNAMVHAWKMGARPGASRASAAELHRSSGGLGDP